jgi:hypothetical protein
VLVRDWRVCTMGAASPGDQHEVTAGCLGQLANPELL